MEEEQEKGPIYFPGYSYAFVAGKGEREWREEQRRRNMGLELHPPKLGSLCLSLICIYGVLNGRSHRGRVRLMVEALVNSLGDKIPKS